VKKITQRIRDLEKLVTYIKYQRLLITIDKNLVAAEIKESKLEQVGEKSRTRKAEEIVKAYDILISNTVEKYKFCDQNDKEEISEIAASIFSFRAIRCFYKSIALSEDSNIKSLLLIERTIELIDDAIRHWNECQTHNEKIIEKLNIIRENSKSSKSIVNAKYLLETISTSNESVDLPLIEKTQELSYLQNGNIIEFPPKYQTISCMPISVDLAQRFCEKPDLTEKKKAPRGGILSFFTRN